MPHSHNIMLIRYICDLKQYILGGGGGSSRSVGQNGSIYRSQHHKKILPIEHHHTSTFLKEVEIRYTLLTLYEKVDI